MKSQALSAYSIRNELFLWWLGIPSKPQLIGSLRYVRSSRGVSLEYAKSWVQAGFALSEDLPLIAEQEFFPKENDLAAGAVDDARPDRWGERIIRTLDRPERLSVLEYLYFAGDERFGALGVSTSQDHYLPREIGPLPTLADIQSIYELVQLVSEASSSTIIIDERIRRLLSPGVTLGGARPKALIRMDGADWVVKFLDGEPFDIGLIEHASMTLAYKASIRTAPTKALKLQDGHALAVQRFDRHDSHRLHAISSAVALRAGAQEFGYPQLAQWLRRHEKSGDPQRTELFKRMIFNILIDNTDDHEKNHALLMSDTHEFELSPAYDILPSGQALGYQQLLVGNAGGESSLDNALSQVNQFGLKKDAAVGIIKAVAKTVSSWKEHFLACGVSKADLAYFATHIDRPFLLQQRNEFKS